MNDTLLVPHFARLHEHFGVWAITSKAAEGLWQVVRSMDLSAHIRSAAVNPQRVELPLRMTPGRGKSSIASVQILGVMMKSQMSLGGTSTVAIRRAVRQAADDPNVSGILLEIDSPGGTVAGTADLAEDVKAATRRKPVYVQVHDLCCSAAYWVASQADKIYVNQATAEVGSIGTAWGFEDSSGAAEKTGVKEVMFTSGHLKRYGGGLGFTAEQSAHAQALVNDLQVEFTASVRRGRGLSDTRLEKVLTGAVFTANQAQQLGLIDGIQSAEKTLSQLMSAK